MKNQLPTANAAFIILFLLIALCVSAHAKTLPPHPLFGVTVENLDGFDVSRLNDLIKDKSLPLTVRVIFQKEMLPSDYEGKLQEIKNINLAAGKQKIVVLATLYDSDYLAKYEINYPLKLESQLDCRRLRRGTEDYQLRTFCFVEKLNSYVDVWEVGNEVNGEWADEGCEKNSRDECKSKYDRRQNKYLPKTRAYPERTKDKIEYAVKLARQKAKPVALTLLHQPNCTSWTDNDMFKWSQANITDYIRQNTDYLLVSYYEYNCNRGDGTQGENYWENSVFDVLQGREYFPNSYLGFGEVGYPSETFSCNGGISFCDEETRQNVGEKITLLRKYYGLRVDNTKFIGGFFWWTFQQDVDCSITGNTNCNNFYNFVNDIYKNAR